MEHRVEMVVNGISRVLNVEARITLADALRKELGMKGTRLGCEQGVCGACTVAADGLTVRSCLQLAVQMDGVQIETIEGIGDDGPLGLDLLQEKFLLYRGFQCGFCTSGMILTIRDCSYEECLWDEESLRERLNDNICRCTGYVPIIDIAREYLQNLGKWDYRRDEHDEH